MLTDSTQFLSLFFHAGWVVKSVLLILFILSVISWAVIFGKYFVLKKAQSHNHQFFKFFLAEKDFNKISSRLSHFNGAPLAHLFKAGFSEISAFKNNPPENNIMGAIRKESGLQLLNLEKSIPFLATIGSTAPFIGLFGTVWGIYDSFQRIGLQKTASLATVAPGIAEALIATAAGLFVAIPAVMFFNHYNNKIQNISQQMDHFEIDFLNAHRRG